MKNRIFRIVLTLVIGIVLIGAVAIWWNFRAGRVTDIPSVILLPSAGEKVAEDALSANNTEEVNNIPPVTPVPSSGEKTTGDTAPNQAFVALARNLEIPWALDFLPDGSFGFAQDKSIIFTERPGRVRLIDADKGLLAEPLLTIGEVAPRGEGGLLGIAVHPDFARNSFVYVYYTYQGEAGLANRVVSFRLEGLRLVDKQIIIDGIPASSIHDGGRLKFGPDGLLYITTGDASQSDSAQNLNSLAGKILRLKDDGSIPANNPFPGSPVYSLGHRNPQGLAWDDKGGLWETEHGSSARDELNLIQAGKNYGWPVIRGDEAAAGMEKPVLHSGDDTWAPSGLAFFEGSLYFAGLRGQTLYRAVILKDEPSGQVSGEKVELRRHLVRSFGRLRDVVIGPDKFFYLLTSNRDGRAVPAAEDDLIIRADPAQLAGR